MKQPETRYRVWDLPVRLFHWTLVLLVGLLWFTGEFGGLDIYGTFPLVGDLYYSNMDVHAVAGQSVLVLVMFRLLWGIWGSTTARFRHFVKGPSAVAGEAVAMLKGRITSTTGHNALGGAMVVCLLLFLAAQASTGLFAKDDLFFSGPLSHLVTSDTADAITTWHKRIFSVLEVLVILHILAVVYYLLRGRNLIGAMITGRKKQSPGEALAFSPWWLALATLAVAIVVLVGLKSL